MIDEHVSRFLVPSRIAGLFFVALAVAALNWSLRAPGGQWVSICLALSIIPVTNATAPRGDLMTKVLADRTSVKLGRFLAEPAFGAMLCLVSTWVAAIALGFVESADYTYAAIWMSGVVSVTFGLQVAGTAFVLRKRN